MPRGSTRERRIGGEDSTSSTAPDRSKAQELLHALELRRQLGLEAAFARGVACHVAEAARQPPLLDREVAPPHDSPAPEQGQRVVAVQALAERRVGLEAV